MKFNRNKLVVHRIFFSRPRAVFDLGSIGRAHWAHRKKTGIRPKKAGLFSRAMASILVSHRCPPPGVLPATQLCWDLGLFDQVDGWT